MSTPKFDSFEVGCVQKPIPKDRYEKVASLQNTNKAKSQKPGLKTALSADDDVSFPTKLSHNDTIHSLS